MLVGLLGHAIAYSASPAMQNAAFRAAGLEGWSYELFDVAPDDLAPALAALRLPGRAGANVTIPHKLNVIPHLDRLDATATEVGAVNFIRRDGDLLVGGNTDVDGVAAALVEVGWEGGEVVILGRGGSALAAAAAVRERATGIRFVSRAEWPERGRWTREASLVINCTPVGRGGEAAVRPPDLPAGGAIIDLVYAKGGTPLTASARAAGLPTADGWTVLVAQGAASFTGWTGLPAPAAAMRAALPR